MDANKPQKKQQWLLLMVISLFISTVLIFIALYSSSAEIYSFYLSASRNKDDTKLPDFVESKLHESPTRKKDTLPRLAYLISGSKGDGESLKRTLKALYHPRNQYVLHLDMEAPVEERTELAMYVRDEAVFAKLGNVRMVKKANLITYKGPTMVSNTLHAAAILLREGGDWDWFINLSASDYPLVTQDDLLHALSSVPRYLNFIEHTSKLGWKANGRGRPILIDPALYSSQKSEIIWATEKRSLPTAYRLFTGSAWMMLSLAFVEYMIMGWDNLPRIVLMYYANFISTPEGYFHTVICNAEEFKNTTVNHDLHFISWDRPPKQHPHYLTSKDYQKMVDSKAPFARKFPRNESVLDKIDSDLLARPTNGFVPGAWMDSLVNGSITDEHVVLKDTTNLRPGAGAERVNRLIQGMLTAGDFHRKQCA